MAERRGRSRRPARLTRKYRPRSRLRKEIPGRRGGRLSNLAVFRLLCHRVRLGLGPVPPRLSIHVNFGPFKLTLWLPLRSRGAWNWPEAAPRCSLGDRCSWCHLLMGPGYLAALLLSVVQRKSKQRSVARRSKLQQQPESKVSETGVLQRTTDPRTTCSSKGRGQRRVGGTCRAARARSGGSRTMEAREKEAQVAAWLKKIFGDHPIPQYEVNSRTTEILHHLSERNRTRDRDVSLVIEDLRQKAGEYEAEAKQLQDFLMESVSLSPANLSSTGSKFLSALVDSAVALETKDTSLASFIPAVNDLTSDLFCTKSKNEEIKLELAKLEKNLTATLVLEKCLQDDLKKAELHLSRERAKVDSRLQNMGFLQAKSGELRLAIKAAEEQLPSRGMDASLSHQSLVALSEKLADLKEQTIPLKKKLESYLDLMPNPSLAQVKIEEAKRELDFIEAELTKKIDMMEL